MKLTDYYVICINGKTHIVFDDINQYLMEMLPEIFEKYQKDSNIIKQLNYEDWSLDDLIEIGEEILSCINKHAITNNLLKIKESMKKVGINEKQILKFMQEYIKELFDEYGE